MTERSLFRIYSMTKSVTAVAVMMLHEERRFALDDPVATLSPNSRSRGVRRARRRTAPAGAADHRPRISCFIPPASTIERPRSYRREQVRARTMTMTQFIANLVRVPLMEDPGTRYRYSESTTVLGRLVEIWSGKPFEVFLEERIFRPLRMTDTMFWAATPEQRTRLTTVYGPAPGGGLTKVEIETVPFTERPTLIEGAVGLLSTVPDYLRFGQMLLNKGELDGVRLLSAKTVGADDARTGCPTIVQKARGGSMGWGLANVNVLLNPAATGPVEPRRIRVGRHGRHDLLGRSRQRNGDGADDPELAVEPRSDPSAVQGHRAAGASSSDRQRPSLYFRPRAKEVPLAVEYFGASPGFASSSRTFG